jgi:phosphoserine phosphatase RsbU/P
MPDVKILIVEDDEADRRLLVEYLQARTNASVDSARDGIEALHQISTNPYDVVVLDVMMPKMSGVDFLDSLKALSSDPSFKALESPPDVIVITAASDALLPNDVIAHRFPEVVRAVFRKPLDIERFSASVNRQLMRRGAAGS